MARTPVPTPRVDFGRLGPVRVGMTMQQLARATGAPVRHDEPASEDTDCFYGSTRGLPVRTSLMFAGQRLARIDISGPGVRTRSGAGVGTTEAALKRLYGNRLRQQPHAYTGPAGHYLTVLSPDRATGIRFETDGTRVTDYYTGTAQAIQYVEGCQ